MTKYFTLNRNYQDIKIAVDASAGEVHIIPVLSTGEMNERVVIPNDSRASWYVGNRYFETGQGKEVYTQDSLGGQTSIFKHVREVASSVLFTSTGKLCPPRPSTPGRSPSGTVLYSVLPPHRAGGAGNS